MNSDEFIRHHFGVFEPDPRIVALENRLQQYYDETAGNMSNKEAYRKWKEVREWAIHNGFTIEEVNKAKRSRPYN